MFYLSLGYPDDSIYFSLVLKRKWHPFGMKFWFIWKALVKNWICSKCYASIGLSYLNNWIILSSFLDDFLLELKMFLVICRFWPSFVSSFSSFWTIWWGMECAQNPVLGRLRLRKQTVEACFRFIAYAKICLLFWCRFRK